jgi:hypothetical protein
MKRTVLLASLAALGAAFSFVPVSAQNVRQELFLPDYGTNQTVSATTTSSSVTLTGNSLNDSIIRISNAGTVTVFCRAGNGAQTATAADVAILGGSSMHISKPTPGPVVINTVACLASSTTATVYVSTGNNGF